MFKNYIIVISLFLCSCSIRSNINKDIMKRTLPALDNSEYLINKYVPSYEYKYFIIPYKNHIKFTTLANINASRSAIKEAIND